jgi:hypothetical protein
VVKVFSLELAEFELRGDLVLIGTEGGGKDLFDLRAGRVMPFCPVVAGKRFRSGVLSVLSPEESV